jgi:GT2 family glycosyltransferase
VAKPWLSVVVPTFNGAAFLPAALEGIRRQGDLDLEVIAVDDGSSDATLAVLDSWASRLPLRVVRRDHTGSWVANSNHGLAQARADHVCFLHQDDLWLSDRLRVVKPLLVGDPRTVLVLHASWFIGPDGRRLGRWRCPLPTRPGGLEPDRVVERLLVQNFIAMPAPIFRRDAAMRVGGMDERLWYTADWDLWLKLAGAGKTVYCPRALAAFRIHPQSQTVRRTTGAADLRRQLEIVLDRHLTAWKGNVEVLRAARFSVEVNLALAARAHGQWPDWRALSRRGLALGLAGWHRYLRDSRLAERLRARLGLLRQFPV